MSGKVSCVCVELLATDAGPLGRTLRSETGRAGGRPKPPGAELSRSRTAANLPASPQRLRTDRAGGEGVAVSGAAASSTQPQLPEGTGRGLTRGPPLRSFQTSPPARSPVPPPRSTLPEVKPRRQRTHNWESVQRRRGQVAARLELRETWPRDTDLSCVGTGTAGQS